MHSAGFTMLWHYVGIMGRWASSLSLITGRIRMLLYTCPLSLDLWWWCDDDDDCEECTCDFTQDAGRYSTKSRGYRKLKAAANLTQLPLHWTALYWTTLDYFVVALHCSALLWRLLGVWPFGKFQIPEEFIHQLIKLLSCRQYSRWWEGALFLEWLHSTHDNWQKSLLAPLGQKSASEKCRYNSVPKKLKGGGYQVTNSHSQTFRQQSLSMKLSLVHCSFITF